MIGTAAQYLDRLLMFVSDSIAAQQIQTNQTATIDYTQKEQLWYQFSESLVMECGKMFTLSAVW